jgi:hypothetical protein
VEGGGLISGGGEGGGGGGGGGGGAPAQLHSCPLKIWHLPVLPVPVSTGEHFPVELVETHLAGADLVAAWNLHDCA